MSAAVWWKNRDILEETTVFVFGDPMKKTAIFIVT
jgi:hypothetical protein